MTVRSLITSVGNVDLGAGKHLHNGVIATLAYEKLSVDKSIVAGDGYQTLLTVNVQKKTADSALKFTFMCSVSNDTNATAMKFRLRVNGETHQACGCRGQNGIAQAAGLVHVHTDLPESIYTVAIEWSTSGGTASCRPLTHSDDESAALVVEEILQA